METIKLYNWQINFIKDLLREYPKSEQTDRDTRMMARDIDAFITEQYPDTVHEIDILTGKITEIKCI